MNDINAKRCGPAILAKLHQLMAKVPYLQRDAENKEQRYKYLSSEAVAEKIQAALVELRLVSVPQFETLTEKEYATAKGHTWKYVRTKLTLQVFDVDTGEYCVVITEGSGTDPGDKAVAKAQTMAMKIAWTKLTNVPIGDDPEADPATDRQQFVPTTFGSPVYFGFPAYEQEIVHWWKMSGWPTEQIPSWVYQRYGREPSGLTPEECYSLAMEFKSYYEQKMGGTQA